LVAAKIRDVARRVVAELTGRLRIALSRAMSGARRPGATTGRPSGARDIAWAETIRRNLRHYDPVRQVLIAERLRFHGHVRQHLPWTIVMCIDQSGSMATSVIHAAVMAAILGGLPAVTVKLVVFDTAVVDLSDRVGDPVDVLMAVQLGGGTDIGRALAYCEARHVVRPERTVVVLVSDFCEGAAPGPLIATVRRLAGARVTLLGLAALDDAARPDYDRAMAEQLATAGMHVAALTPEHFATWIAARIR
ncbi:MAG: VWA domain-containing protein, partial [Janthinobacterium lividum]